MMVLDQAGLLVLEPGEDSRYRLSPVVPDSDRHRVHEQSDHRVGARQLRRSARHRGAEHHVVPPGQCAEHDRPGALQHGVEGQAVRAGEVGHRAGRGLVQDRLDLPLGPVPAGPRTVGLSSDRSGSARLPTDGAEPGRLLHTRQRAGPGRDRAGTVPGTQPGDVVPHLRRRWERATARVVVQRHQLAQHDRQRPSVHDEVVDGQHQARTPLVQPEQRHPQQRGYGKVEGPGPVVVRDPGGVLGRSDRGGRPRATAPRCRRPARWSARECRRRRGRRPPAGSHADTAARSPRCADAGRRRPAGTSAKSTMSWTMYALSEPPVRAW